MQEIDSRVLPRSASLRRPDASRFLRTTWSSHPRREAFLTRRTFLSVAGSHYVQGRVDEICRRVRWCETGSLSREAVESALAERGEHLGLLDHEPLLYP